MAAMRRYMSTIPKAMRAFSTTRRAAIQVGDAIPDIELYENSPGNRISINKALGSKGLLIGVPAAFSPSCSARHIPGYIKSPKLKEAGHVVVVSVNDPFVMKAWAESLDYDSTSKIRFLADPHAVLTNALELSFDSTAIFGQPRSRRYAIVVEDGKVKQLHVEPDNTGVDVSSAEKVLG